MPPTTAPTLQPTSNVPVPTLPPTVAVPTPAPSKRPTIAPTAPQPTREPTTRPTPLPTVACPGSCSTPYPISFGANTLTQTPASGVTLSTVGTTCNFGTTGDNAIYNAVRALARLDWMPCFSFCARFSRERSTEVLPIGLGVINGLTGEVPNTHICTHAYMQVYYSFTPGTTGYYVFRSVSVFRLDAMAGLSFNSFLLPTGPLAPIE